MGAKKRARTGREAKPEGTASVRATISFSSEQYKTLEEIARQKKVSLAWVVREAVDNYVSDRQPLFSNLKGNV